MDKNRTKTQQYNQPKQKELRRQLRKGGEAPEAVLWTMLKGRQVEGMKFRRQFGVGPYVLDFYCPEIKLGIELDGASHFMSNNFAYDDVRTEYLFREHGIRIMRFENRTLFYNPEGVVESIVKMIHKLSQPLRPTDTSPKTGEE